MKAQRAVAVLITVLFFALVVFGAGAVFATAGHRTWGYAAGGLFCVVMAGAAVVVDRRERAGRSGGSDQTGGRGAGTGGPGPGGARPKGRA
jgi:hypothetical protein